MLVAIATGMGGEGRFIDVATATGQVDADAVVNREGVDAHTGGFPRLFGVAVATGQPVNAGVRGRFTVAGRARGVQIEIGIVGVTIDAVNPRHGRHGARSWRRDPVAPERGQCRFLKIVVGTPAPWQRVQSAAASLA